MVTACLEALSLCLGFLKLGCCGHPVPLVPAAPQGRPSASPQPLLSPVETLSPADFSLRLGKACFLPAHLGKHKKNNTVCFSDVILSFRTRGVLYLPAHWIWDRFWPWSGPVFPSETLQLGVQGSQELCFTWRNSRAQYWFQNACLAVLLRGTLCIYHSLRHG